MYQVISLAEFEATKSKRLRTDNLTLGTCRFRLAVGRSRMQAIESFIEILEIIQSPSQILVRVGNLHGDVVVMTLNSDSFVIGWNIQQDGIRAYNPLGYFLALADWDAGLAELTQRQHVPA